MTEDPDLENIPFGNTMELPNSEDANEEFPKDIENIVNRDVLVLLSSVESSWATFFVSQMIDDPFVVSKYTLIHLPDDDHIRGAKLKRVLTADYSMTYPTKKGKGLLEEEGNLKGNAVGLKIDEHLP